MAIAVQVYRDLGCIRLTSRICVGGIRSRDSEISVPAPQVDIRANDEVGVTVAVEISRENIEVSCKKNSFRRDAGRIQQRLLQVAGTPEGAVAIAEQHHCQSSKSEDDIRAAIAVHIQHRCRMIRKGQGAGKRIRRSRRENALAIVGEHPEHLGAAIECSLVDQQIRLPVAIEISRAQHRAQGPQGRICKGLTEVKCAIPVVEQGLDGGALAGPGHNGQIRLAVAVEIGEDGRGYAESLIR